MAADRAARGPGRAGLWAFRAERKLGSRTGHSSQASPGRVALGLGFSAESPSPFLGVTGRRPAPHQELS